MTYLPNRFCGSNAVAFKFDNAGDQYNPLPRSAPWSELAEIVRRFNEAPFSDVSDEVTV